MKSGTPAPIQGRQLVVHLVSRSKVWSTGPSLSCGATRKGFPQILAAQDTCDEGWQSLLGSSGTPLICSDTGLFTGRTIVGLASLHVGSGEHPLLGSTCLSLSSHSERSIWFLAHTHMTFHMPWKEVFPDTPRPVRKCFPTSPTWTYIPHHWEAGYEPGPVPGLFLDV